MPGDYDGDGSSDVAIYRPSTGQWFFQAISPQVTSRGAGGDIPVGLPHAVGSRFFPGA